MDYQQRPFGTSLLAFIGGAIAWAFMGPAIKRRLGQSQAWAELKKEVRDEAMKTRDLTEDKYNRIVDEISERFGRLRGISQNELPQVVADLKKNWERIKAAWSNQPR